MPITTRVGLRRFSEAIELTKTHLQRFPNDPLPYFVRARIEGQPQRSIEPLRAALRDRLVVLLAAERPPDMLSRLYDEGRRLTDDEACALAFPPLALST